MYLQLKCISNQKITHNVPNLSNAHDIYISQLYGTWRVLVYKTRRKAQTPVTLHSYTQHALVTVRSSLESCQDTDPHNAPVFHERPVYRGNTEIGWFPFTKVYSTPSILLYTPQSVAI